MVAYIGTAILLTTAEKLAPAINEVHAEAVAAQAEVTAARGIYGTLDSRLDTELADAVATTAEVTEARGIYGALDTRLDYLTTLANLSGGNVATKANGVSNAGQKVLTVDATTGFVVGANVAYLLNGTTLQGNVIGSIQAGVSLTLVDDLGTGGVLDDTYVSMIPVSEYMAAQAIPHAGTLLLPQTMEYANGGVFNVAAYGASPSAAGSVNVAALNAAWAALTAGDTLVLPSGTYAISDTVDWSDKEYITIIGNNSTISAETGANFTNKTMLYMAGSTYATVKGLRLNCTLALNLPKAGIVLGRVDAGDGGGMRFEDCWFSGAYTHSIMYDVGSELTSFWHCRWQTDVAGIPCYYTSSTDDTNLVPQDAVSNVCKRFYDCAFWTTQAQRRAACWSNVTLT